jgi:hypothetical protein
MSIILKVFLFASGLIFTLIAVGLLLKRRINERHSIVWFFGLISILLISANPEWLDKLASSLGIAYPPSLLFLFSNLVLMLLVLYQSLQISTLNEKLKQLAQHISLLDLQETAEKDNKRIDLSAK